jgi:NhaA family Na+:H+ antiporter
VTPESSSARRPLREFIASEAAGGIVLMAAAALALLAANLPMVSGLYFDTLALETGPVLAPAHGPMTLHAWVNDALMALFFFVVGLEIRGEFAGGALATAQQRRLPVIAAAAGMLAPALVYLAVTWGTGLAKGWAIPAATDIAFAMGVLALLGRHAPGELRTLLVTIAVVDDIGAVAIIALAYSAHLDLPMLVGAASLLAAMALLNRAGVARPWPYLALGLFLWFLVYRSGVHATVAGVAAAMTVPASARHRLEAALNPWVAFGVVPLFGFANAGVSLSGMTPSILLAPLPLGIALGLVLGKQAGIFGAIWVAAKARIAEPPGRWVQVYGIALLAGIGFTMSLFIGGLAFPGRPELADEVKVGVLAGSLVSALAGYGVLRLAGGRD